MICPDHMYSELQKVSKTGVAAHRCLEYSFGSDFCCEVFARANVHDVEGLVLCNCMFQTCWAGPLSMLYRTVLGFAAVGLGFGG